MDSDILIEATSAKDTAILRRWVELSESQDIVLCSPVSVAELWQGALPSERAALTSLFQAIPCVQVDEETGRQAGEFLRTYRKSHGLELGDALIAASAVLHTAALWTRSRKHYPMIRLSFF